MNDNQAYKNNFRKPKIYFKNNFWWPETALLCHVDLFD